MTTQQPADHTPPSGRDADVPPRIPTPAATTRATTPIKAAPIQRSPHTPRTARSLRTAAAALVVVLVALLPGCAPQVPGGGAAHGTVTLGISVPTMNASWIELAVAEGRGYFAEEGISVKPQFLKSSGGVLQSMAVGRTDIGGPTPEAVLPALEQGQDLRMVYQWTRRPVQSLAVLSSDSVKSFADMKGKTIGVSALSSGAKILADASLQTVGMNPAQDVDYLAVGVGIAAWDALRRGRVDAIMLWDAEYAAMENAGAELRYIRAPQLDNLFSTTLVAEQDWLKGNRKQMEGFGRAWAKASAWAGAHPEEAIRTMWKLYPESRTSTDEKSLMKDQLNVFEQRHKVVTMGDPASTRDWGRYDADSVAHWVEVAQKAGLLTKKVPVSDVYTNRYVAAYNAFTPADLKSTARPDAGP